MALAVSLLGAFGSAGSAAPLGDPPLDERLDAERRRVGLEADEDAARPIVPYDYAMLQRHRPGALAIDTALAIGLAHAGRTPYLWGGDDWRGGMDCSHFTRKIFETAGSDYRAMMTTADLRDLTAANGLRRIALEEARAGDLLVYGYYDAEGWHGHVVVLVDPHFSYGGHQGLVVGSHGGVGVAFVTYEGFPRYWREPRVELRNVLRVVAR